MTTRIRMFQTEGLVPVPRHWLADVGASNKGEAYVIAIARIKSDVEVILQNAGASPAVYGRMRLAQYIHTTALMLLTKERIIDPATPGGLYAYEPFRHGGVIVEIRGREPHTIARWVVVDAPGTLGHGAIAVERLSETAETRGGSR